MRLVVATKNSGKLQELERLLPSNLELISLSSLGVEAPDETGHSFLDNAILKAQHAAMCGFPAIADDSGLEVDALKGAPGIRSARFAGPDASDEHNNARLIADLKRIGSVDRRARFRCAVALGLPDGTLVTASGSLDGVVIDEPRGSNGFGYDPYFQVQDSCAPEAEGMTLAELALTVKNRISHRARAYKNLVTECSNRADLHPIFAMIGANVSPGGRNP